jgi:putative transposase
MPNHLHPILAPRSSEGLARAIGAARRQVTALVKVGAGTGHLFQWRFSSVALDEENPEAAARDVALKGAA